MSTFHEVPVGARLLACDECSCVIDGSEQGRAKHDEWHQGREELVVDLRAVKSLVA